MSFHLEVRSVRIRATKSQSLDTFSSQTHFLDTATHSIDTRPAPASNHMTVIQ
jgi:hypothetical protein